MKCYEIGGQEIVTATLAQCFIKHGHKITIACFNPPNPIMIQRTNPEVKFYTLGSFSLSQHNIKCLRNILAKEKINIVINQWGLPYIPIQVLNKAKHNLAIKIISIYHNSPDSNARIKGVEIELNNTNSYIKKFFLHIKKFFFKQTTRLSMCYVYNHSDLYMVLSPSFVEKFKAFTKISSPTKLLVQTNPVTIDATDFHYISQNKQKEIIYMGRIDYNQKRVYRVIETWKEIENLYPEWRLSIIGDGPERNNLEQKVKELNLKHISFEGFQQPKAYYERASILILTSEYEGFPLVLAECMSFGVIPVVYGSYSAVYDIIKHEKNGIIIQPKNNKFSKVDAAKQLSNIMDNNIKREKMAQMAIKTSKENYSLEKIYQSWETIFRNVVYDII